MFYRCLPMRRLHSNNYIMSMTKAGACDVIKHCMHPFIIFYGIAIPYHITK